MVKKLTDEDLEKKGGIDEELSELYRKSIKSLREGQIVKGKIVQIKSGAVFVDVGYKSEGLITINEFSNPSQLKVGDEIEVLVETLENENGSIVLSKEKADRTQGWERVISKFGEGDPISGKVTRKVKGGFMVDIGIEAFLPASLTTIRGIPAGDNLFGQSLDFKIIKINKARRNIVLSRKEILRQQIEESRNKLLGELEKGKLVKGVVKNITDFGAFVDLGGLDGLLHITDMTWSRISHPSEVLAIGDTIEVVVLNFDRDHRKISLGLKQKTANPWQDVDTKYPAGSKVKGKVVNILPYGAFIELEKGIEALAHISEFSWSKRYNHPSELLAIGDIVEAVVLDIDKANQKISLGLKQLEQDPWGGVEEKYPVGTKVKGKIRNLTDYGAFVQLEDGIDGLIHVSDMSWTRKINHPRDILRKGQKIETVVLGVDTKNRRISLGFKQLIPDPWLEIAERYKVDSVVSGTITKITNFGIFIELEKDMEGLVHISELEQKSSLELQKVYKVGDSVQAKVLNVDAGQRRISLSLK